MRKLGCTGLVSIAVLFTSRAFAAGSDATPNIEVEPPNADAGVPLPTLPPAPVSNVPPAPPAPPAPAPAPAPQAAPSPQQAAPPALPPAPVPVTVARPDPFAVNQESKFSFGIEAGYSIPFGSVMSGDPLSGIIDGVVSGRLVAGGFVTPHFYVGGALGAGLIPIVTVCTSTAFATGTDTTCSAYQIRLGIETQWHFSPQKRTDFWVGAGAGYEWINLSSEGSEGDTDPDTTAGWINGIEFLNLKAGLDVKPVNNNWSVGPFVELSLGHYWFEPATVHGFLTLGARVRSLL